MRKYCPTHVIGPVLLKHKSVLRKLPAPYYEENTDKELSQMQMKNTQKNQGTKSKNVQNNYTL